jgi:hypothetical protein
MTSTKSPTLVSVNVTLMAIGSFREIEMTFAVRFLVAMR